MGNGAFYVKEGDNEFFIFHNKINNNNNLKNLKNKIAQRSIDPNKYYDEILKNKKEGILNKFNDPEFLLKTTQLIESDAATLGTIIKEEIIKEKNENPNKFFDIDELIKNKNNKNFAVGILAKSLENEGICTAIEKKSENINVSNAILQFITNGTVYKKKFKMTYNYNENEINKILYDEENQNYFINNVKSFISNHLGINKKFINICNFRKGSNFELIFDLIFDNTLTIKKINKNDPLRTLNDNFNELVYKLKMLSKIDNNLKEVSPRNLFEGIKLCPEMFDSKGNNNDGGWAPDGEMRGGTQYFPPHGWIGHGLNVLNRFDGGNNKWIGMKNLNGEWCVAYHGTGINVVKSILESQKFIAGNGQSFELDYDLNHDGQKIGKGVYCTPQIKIAENYGKIINGYKVAFMCRVNPRTVRICSTNQFIWVVDGTSNEIRPYRLLVRKE